MLGSIFRNLLRSPRPKVVRQHIRPIFRAFPFSRQYYVINGIGLFTAISIAMFPVIEVVCQNSPLMTGTPQKGHLDYTPQWKSKKQENKAKNRLIRVHFDYVKETHMPWDFKPCQKYLVVTPGETALAFYRARNTSSEPVIGYAAYSVTPGSLAKYFNKIQCFCFEEQILGPGEEIELPVFFYIDSSMMDNRLLDYLDEVILTYYIASSEAEVPEEYMKYKNGVPA